MKKSTACRRLKGFIGYVTFVNALYVPSGSAAEAAVCAYISRFRFCGAVRTSRCKYSGTNRIKVILPKSIKSMAIRRRKNIGKGVYLWINQKQYQHVVLILFLDVVNTVNGALLNIPIGLKPMMICLVAVLKRVVLLDLQMDPKKKTDDSELRR